MRAVVVRVIARVRVSRVQLRAVVVSCLQKTNYCVIHVDAHDAVAILARRGGDIRHAHIQHRQYALQVRRL